MGVRIPFINTVCLTGRTTRAAEMRGNGKVMAFSLAVNNRFKDKNGEWQDNAIFINCVAFGKMAEKSDRIGKGTPLMVEGRLDVSEWKTDSGDKRSQVQVVAERVQILETRDTTANSAEQKATESAPSNDVPY